MRKQCYYTNSIGGYTPTYIGGKYLDWGFDTQACYISVEDPGSLFLLVLTHGHWPVYW